MKVHQEQLGPTVLKLTVSEDGEVVSVARWCELMATSGSARLGFHEALAATPFTSFCWECAPQNGPGVDAPFECVVVDSPALQSNSADASPFARPFAEARHACTSATVAVFANLGGDTTLISPLPSPEAPAYPHLAAFLRTAPEDVVHELWERVAVEWWAHLGSEPVWLSTAGLGVPWLHIRLASWPKYYRYHPYHAFK